MPPPASPCPWAWIPGWIPAPSSSSTFLPAPHCPLLKLACYDLGRRPPSPPSPARAVASHCCTVWMAAPAGRHAMCGHKCMHVNKFENFSSRRGLLTPGQDRQHFFLVVGERDWWCKQRRCARLARRHARPAPAAVFVRFGGQTPVFCCDLRCLVFHAFERPLLPPLSPTWPAVSKGGR